MSSVSTLPNLIIAFLDKGGVTLIAASIAAVASIGSVIFSIVASRSQAKLTARLADLTNLGKEAREYRLKQLTSFYDPVYTLLAANKSIFERIGPTSVARREQKFNDQETAEVWKKLSNEVIVPNNNKICEIIHANLHYLAEFDDEAIYLEFLTHAYAYQGFKQSAYEAYLLFPFPRDFFETVKAGRSGLRAGLAKNYSQSL